MRIILSRKGFDAGYGGEASPIFPDNSMVSIPIPGNPHDNPKGYSDITKNIFGQSFDSFVDNLGRKRKQGIALKKSNVQSSSNYSAHIDPDIDITMLPNRPKGWKGAFGQQNGVQTSLKNASVEVGDLFLFYGWFGFIDQSLQYHNKNMHVIFGWLHIGDIIYPNCETIAQIQKNYPWLLDHPHMYNICNRPNNAIYIASDGFKLNNTKFNGYGTLSFDQKRQLTTPGKTRKYWTLPDLFNDGQWNNKAFCQYKHPDVNFPSPSPGQEFVFEPNQQCQKKLDAWIHNILT